MHALISGGFVPGELAGFQETSRSQNASTTGAGQAGAKKSGRRRETRPPPIRRPLTSTVNSPGRPKPGGRRNSPDSAAAQTQDDQAAGQQDRRHGQHTNRHTGHRQPALPGALGGRPLHGARAPLAVLTATGAHHDLVAVVLAGPTRGLRAGARTIRHRAAIGGRSPRSGSLRTRLGCRRRGIRARRRATTGAATLLLRRGRAPLGRKVCAWTPPAEARTTLLSPAYTPTS